MGLRHFTLLSTHLLLFLSVSKAPAAMVLRLCGLDHQQLQHHLDAYGKCKFPDPGVSASETLSGRGRALFYQTCQVLLMLEKHGEAQPNGNPS